jgi:hypothetical protein
MIARRFMSALLAVLVALVMLPAAPAWAQPADTDDGPGRWGPAAPGGSKAGSPAYNYEGQINGRGAQWNYWVPYPETRAKPGFDINTWEPWKTPIGQPRDGAAFDGWNRADRTLLDAKGPRYAYLLDPKNSGWSKARDTLLEESARQQRAAQGTPVRWHWAETGAHQQMESELRGRGIGSRTTLPRDPTLMSGPGSPNNPNGAATPRGPAARPVAGAPGGIDFSRLQLKYVSAGAAGQNSVGYSFQTPSATIGDADLNAARDASDAFFVWLSLQPSQLWVNLNPSQPDLIIDADLARTEAGRVMLTADLQLKRTMTPLTGPGTPIGDDFVRKIFAGPDEDRCLSYRFWVEPAPATVRDTGDELYILDAPLAVKSETMYIIDPATGQRTCPGQTEQRARYNESVMDTVVLPHVRKAVNEAPEYADLRRVYLSRVAAEWYKQVSAARDTFFKPMIGSGIVGPWVSARTWNPRAVFDEYLGVYNKSTGTIEIGGVTYTFVFGGVDLAQAPQTPMSAPDFAAKHPALPAVVKDSTENPAPDPQGKLLWAGGTTVLESDDDPPPPDDPADPPPSGLPITGTTPALWLAGIVLLIGGVLLLALVRRRRRQFVA